jgi:hypothetical protein
MTAMNYMKQREDGRSEIIGTIGNNGNRVAQAVYSVWLRTGRPGDRGSIPGRGKGFFL